MKKFFSLLLTLAMIFTMVIGGSSFAFAADSTAATTMKIAGTDGTVTITTDKGKDIAANVDTKLLNGYTIKTAAASYCFISLDDSKAIKLGQNTKVKVEKSGKKIELDVKSGEIYFDVDKKLSGNESMNIKTGNMTTGIRGTSGVTIVSHNMYSITPDASGIKPQETASNTLFQLFSGSTVVKENNPTSLKSLLGRLLSAVPGSGAKINPIKTPGPITAQAGQQIAIAAAPKGGGETTASRFETQALAVNEFGARAVLEAAAIKTGMSAGEALTVGTAQIVAQVGEGLTQTLVAAGVAQAAVTQVAEAASDPAKLDSAKQNAELQAALAELTNTGTIDTAKQDAAKVEGTKTNDKALEKVDVQAGSGANAGGLKLSDDGTSTTATQSPQTSTGGHSGGSSGGSSQSSSWLQGYTGTYDGESHDVLALMESDDRAQLEQYSIWVFKAKENDDPNGPYTGIYESLQEEYDLAVKRLTESEQEYTEDEASGRVLESLSGVQHGVVTSDGSQYRIRDVNQSGTFYYFAVKNDNYKEVHKGSFNANVNRAELVVKWVLESNAYTYATQGAVYPTATTAIPVRPVIGVMQTSGGTETFIPAGTELFAGTDTLTTDGVSQEVSFAPAMTGIAPTGAGNYTAQVSSIISGASSDSPLYGVTQTDNYYWPGTNKTYSYTVSGSGTGSGGTGSTGPSTVNGSFFSTGSWEDRSSYDIAFVANGTQSDPTSSDAPPIPVYDKYFKGDTVRSEAGCTVGDIVAVLANTTSYASVYIDTGETIRPVDVDMNINTGSFNRAVFISGAGFDLNSSKSVITNATGTNGELYLKLGSSESDVTTILENVQNIYIDSKATFTNFGEIALGYSMVILGDVENYGGIYISEDATGSNGPITIRNRGVLEQYDGGMIWDKRPIKINSNASLTGGRITYAVETGGTMKLWGGDLRRSLTNDAELPEEANSKVETIARAIFSVQGTERIECNTGNYSFARGSQGGAMTEPIYDGIVLCNYSGGGTVLGARLEGDNRVFNDAEDFGAGTFFVTGENTLYNYEADVWFVEIEFPHPAGTFAPAN